MFSYNIVILCYDVISTSGMLCSSNIINSHSNYHRLQSMKPEFDYNNNHAYIPVYCYAIIMLLLVRHEKI